MSLTCSCPLPTAISDITIDPCPENFGQVQKVIFQRLKDGTSYNEISDADIILEATWTTLTAAVGNTKVQASPFLEAPEVEPGSIREFGGGNETLGGRPITLGSNPTKFNAVFNRKNQSMIKVLKELMCESQLGVFFVNSLGRIAADGVNSGQNRPFEIFSLFVGDKKLGGWDSPDQNEFSFWLPENWSDDFKIYTPEAGFDPLNDI